MAQQRSSRWLLAAVVAWAVFGVWLLFRPDPGSAGFDPLVGHVVVFFFVSVAVLGAAIRPFGVVRGVAASGVAIVLVSLVSEMLQPVLTATRQAQVSDFGANGVGILGAAILTVVLVGAVRDVARRESLTAIVCLVGLVVSAGVVSVGGDRVATAISCWGKGLEVDSSVVDGPIIRVEGQTFSVGDGASLPLGDGLLIDDSADFRCSIVASDSYSVVATVVPESTETGGPMRIFASSEGTRNDQQNTHLGQEFDMLSVRVGYDGGLQWESVPDVFVAGQRVTVAMVVGDGEVNVFVDGEWRASFALESDAFNQWDADFPILVGDEFSRNRTFEGAIESVLVFDRMLAEGDADLSAPGG